MSTDFAPPPEKPLPGPPADYDAAGEAKRLLRAIRAGTLGTLDPKGRPFVTLVNVATAPDGAPVLLLSRLAHHTRFLEERPACSLLLAETGKGDPLAHPRLTVVGAAARDPDPTLRARFLARHPKSALYADFADFSFWRLSPVGFHLNGGFARAADFPAETIMTDLTGAQGLLSAEQGAIDHLNSDHAEALALYAAHFDGQREGNWKATGIDPEGLDLAAGDRTARLRFPQPVTDAGGLRRMLADLAAQARAKA
ncbi:MAG: HugZ family protein [Hyphomicrobiales bacterium]|nr:HugZ family protein [Hyphomicrobiales bacterium]